MDNAIHLSYNRPLMIIENYGLWLVKLPRIVSLHDNHLMRNGRPVSWCVWRRNQVLKYMLFQKVQNVVIPVHTLKNDTNCIQPLRNVRNCIQLEESYSSCYKRLEQVQHVIVYVTCSSPIIREEIWNLIVFNFEGEKILMFGRKIQRNYWFSCVQISSAGRLF